MQEIVADLTYKMFNGDQQAINDFVRAEPNLAQRILEKIKEFIATLTGNTQEPNEMQKRLQKAQELFEQALKDRGQNQSTVQQHAIYDSTNLQNKRVAENTLAEDAKRVYNFEERADSQKETISPVTAPDVSNVTRGKYVDRNDSINDGIKNVRSKNNRINTDNRFFVDNLATSSAIQVTKNGLRHGLNGTLARRTRNAKANAIIGDLIEIARPIREINPREGNVRSFIFLSAMQDETFVYPVILTINETNEDLGQIVAVDALSGINKKVSLFFRCNARHKKRTRRRYAQRSRKSIRYSNRF